MIFIKNNIYAKVWKITKSDKYIDLQITTSEKDGDGNYTNSSWFPRLIGHAFNGLKDTLKEGDRILITKSKMTNEKYTAKDGSTKSAFKFLVMDASIEQKPGDGDATTTAPAQPTQKQDSKQQDDSPW